MWWYVYSADLSLTTDKVEGLTDTDGLLMTSHEANGSIALGFGVEKVGFYSARQGYELAQRAESDPARWNPKVTLLLRKIGHPISMYAKRVNLGMPVFDKPVGFDLMVGDWIAPYGKGLSADILFTGHLDKMSDGALDYTLTVSFPNTGDGIQEFKISELEQTSALRSAHEAPIEGYSARWTQTDNRKPGRPAVTSRDENRSFYYRVRTVLDEKGKVKSALYGKIYGDFMQFQYYLNPTPSDRNVEFDSRHNLVQALKPDEKVQSP
jgi:hypothetical protein